MSAEPFITKHLELWTQAVTTKSTSGRGSNGKIEFAGIQKLRELILELAVRGKLSEQRSTDGSASQLLQQIDTNLNGSGKSKKKRLKALAASDQPYGIPSTWIWARLGMLGQIIGGGTPKSKESAFWTNDGVKWLTPADLYGLTTKTIDSGRRDITQEGLERSSARLLPAQSVLFSSRAPIGYVAINTVELATNQGFKSCVPHIDGLTDYLYYFLKRSAKHIDAQASGTTFKEISGSKFTEWPIALPPLAEQHRIVQKVDELMALCDRLEQQTRDQHAAHATLVAALLDTLTQSAGADELADNWARLAAHFDTLFTTELSIDRLKQTILQLGVMGRLVPQNSNDEPASAMLKNIAATKSRLLSNGMIKRTKPLGKISAEEKPFDIKDSWRWARTDEIAVVQGGIQKQPKRQPAKNAYPYLRVVDVQRGKSIQSNELPKFELFGRELDQYALESGDILVVEGNGSADEIGRCAIWDGQLPECVYQNHLIRVRPLAGESLSRFITLFLNSPAGIAEMKRLAVTTSGLFNLSVSKIRNILIPLPPREEQRRIMTKADELMTICDQLRAHLNQANETRRQIADAVAEQALR